MDKIKEIEELLKGHKLPKKKIQKRLGLINTLENTIAGLIKECPNFKGIEIYGSILNSKFNSNSDIDVCLLWKGYPDRISNRNYHRHTELSAYIKEQIRESTGKIVHACGWLSGEENSTMASCKNPWHYFGVLFGFFLGAEEYREKIAKETLLKFRETGRSKAWHKARKEFENWGHKDLTNPQEDYRLSSFTKLAKDYSIQR